MQKGKLRHIHTASALSTSRGRELQRTNTIVDPPPRQVFITPWKPVYWLFTSFSFKAQDWNPGTRFTVVLSKSVQPVARMTHAVMQRNSGQIFLLNESAHQQYIQQSISLASNQQKRIPVIRESVVDLISIRLWNNPCRNIQKKLK